MNSKVYRWCAVPQCSNTSIKTPDKLFVFVPHKKTIRNEWLKLARRDSTSILPSTHLYFCEDHFDMPNDMENYMEYHLMGSVSQIRMKPGCMPTRYQCQKDRKRRTSHATEQSCILQKHRKTLIRECGQDFEKVTAPTKELKLGEFSSESSISQAYIDHNPQEDAHKKADKSTQVHTTYSNKFSSKSTRAKMNVLKMMSSHLKAFRKSVSTSPFKMKGCITAKPLISTLQSLSKNQCKVEGESVCNFSYTPLVNHRESSPSTRFLLNKSTSDCRELIEENKKQETSKFLEYTLVKIMINPCSYIGVPKNCYYIIEIIEEKTRIPANHIIMCLRKIRTNNPFREIGDDFSMTPTNASKIFLENIKLIASVMRPFIVKLDDSIKQQLPMAFRHKYHNVSCIIDCLEIEVQKPSEAMNQPLLWSEYKKANTIKYLVSCTPNGLVNYISPGYGGRTTDTCLVETCDLIKCLQPGMCVMADRGFKHVEQYLLKEGVHVVRPPSLTTGAKLSKIEARETRQIANLRIHIKRVIRRLREFNMLKPYACLNHNLVEVLDDVITISCGLVNIQDSLN